MTTVTVPHAPIVVRGGPAYWLGGYRTMLRWTEA